MQISGTHYGTRFVFVCIRLAEIRLLCPPIRTALANM